MNILRILALLFLACVVLYYRENKKRNNNKKMNKEEKIDKILKLTKELMMLGDYKENELESLIEEAKTNLAIVKARIEIEKK